jgi:site-specific recombinase XerD
MMTEEICTRQPSFFEDRAKLVIYARGNLAHSPINLHNQKRRALYRWCSRITDSRLPGSGLLVDYLHAKYIKNLSVKTIEQAAGVVLSFLRFLARDGTTIYSLTRQNIGTYVEYEQDRGLKVQSVVNHLRTVYAFIAFLIDQGILPQDMMQRKIRIKLPDPLPRAIPSEDVGLLLEAITSVRDRAMILLLLRTGMRIGELLKVKLTDISLSERKILIYLGEKNYLGRAVYYSEDAEQALQQWLKLRDKDSGYLFPGKAGRPNLSYVAAWSAMKKSLERAGLSGQGYSFHNLRHTFATDMLNAGMRLEVLQQLLGHQDIEMTMRYARITNRTREHEYFKAMERIEQEEHYEPDRINTQLQKVFEKKKLLSSKRK